MKGLPKKYAKMGFKEGWKAYKRDHKQKVYKGSPTKNPTRRKSMTRSKSKRRTRRTRTIPLAPILGASVGILAKPHDAAHNSPLGAFMEKDYAGGFNLLVENFTGLYPPTGNWDITHARGLWGLAAGLVAHKIANALGGNRIFANLPSPLNKLRI